METRELYLGSYIGRGSFGAVYKVKDSTGKNVAAVKRIPIDKKDCIPSLMEASVMASFDHPYINNSIEITTNNIDMCIVQNLADSDLSEVVCYRKNGRPLSEDRLRKWTFQMLKALEFFHDKYIVHGDVKTSNILVFGDTLKISDFTLTKKIWIPGRRINGKAYTVMYRAPEIWIDRCYDYKADIWALGCTMFEMAYGEFLFPPQEGESSRVNLNEDEARLLMEKIRNKSIEAIIDWGRKTKQAVSLESLGIDFVPSANLPPTYPEFNSILLKMLRLDPKQRPTIKMVLEEPYFSGLTMIREPKIKSTPRREISKHSFSRANSKIRRYLHDEVSIQLGLELYVRSMRLEMPSDKKLLICAWIASKIVTGVPFRTELPLAAILEAERTLCFYLRYRLHVIET